MPDLYTEVEAMRQRLKKLIANPRFADTRGVLEIRLETLDELLKHNPPLLRPSAAPVSEGMTSEGVRRAPLGAPAGEAMKPKKPKALRWTRCYWATVTGNRMPCLWGRKRDAIEQCEPEERIVYLRVKVIRNG